MPIRARALRPLAAPAAWSAFIVVPARGWGWLDGLPLGWVEAVTLALVWWVWAGTRRMPAAWVAVALALTKLALAGVFVERGLIARYYANDAWEAPSQRSIEFRGAPFTRIDDRLAFGDGRPLDLPLHFFNHLQWNDNGPNEPRRDQLAFSVEWTGFLHADAASNVTMYVDGGPGIAAELLIDRAPLIPFDTPAPRMGSVDLAPGWHALTIRLRAPYGAGRRFEAGEVTAGTRRPLDRGRVFPSPVSSGRLAIDAVVAWVTRGIDAAALIWLAGLVLAGVRSAARDAAVGRVLWLAAIVEATVYAWPYVGRVTILGGGDDMLMYEHLARVILLGDPLLAERGLGGGQGTPYYFQPLYPYFVSLAHVAFGEGLFGIVLLQRLLVAATVAWAAAITRRLFGSRAGWVAVVAGGFFLYAKLGRWSDVLLAEPLFAPLLVAWSWLLIRLATGTVSPGRLVLAGIVGGVATLTRSTLLAAWPFILAVWWWSRPARRNRSLAILLVAMTAVVGLATLRNWIVTDRFVPIATSFGINFYLGNEPTRPLDPPRAARAAFYDTLGLEPTVRQVVEFAIQAPDAFVRGLANKALYALGFFGWSGLPGGIATSWLYVATWVLALVGVVRAVRAPAAGGAVWLPAVGALTHFAAVVLVFPHGYTDRLIVPLYPLLIPYAAYALEPLPPVLTQAAGRVRRMVDAAGLWLRRHVASVAAPVVRRPRTWLYVAYTIAALRSSDPLTTMLLPVTALVMARVTRRELVHRVVGTILWAAALAGVAFAGSLSAEALHDPLFWGLVAAIALALSLGTGRWPLIAGVTAAVAGGCTMVATLLPMNGSVAILSGRLGAFATWCLLGLCLQAIATGGIGARTGRLTAAARGALVAGLVLTLAGTGPGENVAAPVWLLALGTLLGLVDARTEQPDDQDHHREIPR